MSNKKIIEIRQFEVVSCGFDEYPGDGLRFKADGQLYDKDFCKLELQDGDIVEVTVKVISRIMPAHRETL
jgi:hypothetical protein